MKNEIDDKIDQIQAEVDNFRHVRPKQQRRKNNSAKGLENLDQNLPVRKISIIIVVVTIVIVLFPFGDSGLFELPKLNNQSWAQTEYDYHIAITALISPWTFNVTLMDGFDGSDPDCNLTHIEDLMKEDPKDMSRERVPCNDIDNSLFNNVGIEDYIGVNRLINVDVPAIANKSDDEFIIVAITLLAFDTEHGFTFPQAENPDGILTDVDGNSIEIILAQRRPTTIYLKVPNIAGQEYLYRCSFFCGAGHFGQTGTIRVI